MASDEDKTSGEAAGTDVTDRVVAPGSTLAGRYRIEDLVGESAGSKTWRAFDLVLNRSVGVQMLDANDLRCPAFLDAARRSTRATDPRILPVLDVAEDDDGVAYTIREWARAVPLATLLQEGPLDNRRSANVVSELADALATAHEVGVQHRRLDLTSVLVKDTGAVRINGLATDQALATQWVPSQRAGAGSSTHASPAGTNDTAAQYAAELADVRSLGRILYACLVARWPGSSDLGLPSAPTEHGRLLRPRQVRAGVSRDIDTICDRILGEPPRHHLTPLVTARDVASELLLVGEDELLLTDTQPSRWDISAVNRIDPTASHPSAPPALLPSRPRARPPRRTTSSDRQPGARRTTKGVGGHWKFIGVGVALLVVLAASLAFFVGRYSAEDPRQALSLDERRSQGPGGGGNMSVETLPIRDVVDLDPQGTDGSENPDLVPLAYDGDPATAWETWQYEGSPEFGNLKDGLGLVVDLGPDTTITQFSVAFTGEPTSYSLYASAPGATEPPTDVTGLGAPIRTVEGAGPSSRQRLEPTVTTRYVVLWLTSLPEESPNFYRGVVNEISFEGPAG